ncbi:MAG: flagellar type III secretion system pore protein FliP [Acidobacteriota bacterium]
MELSFRRACKGAMALIVVVLGASLSAFAARGPARSTALQIPGVGSVSWTILIFLTFITLIPAVLLSMTPFVRILVVFHFLRQALGTESAPSNQILIGLALFLTYFIMQPVAGQIFQASVVPMENGKVTVWQALDRSAAPIRNFMLKFTREKDLAVFVKAANLPRPKSPKDLPLRVVVPAYIISELQAGFQIGLVLFLPFMVIDLVVASVTTSVGMLQLPPVVISTPLKILLFVMVDGWSLVVGSLIKSFH